MKAMVPRAILAAVAAFAAAGCRPIGRTVLEVPPLRLQQQQAYPETVTGRFVSLADFEDDPLLVNRPGHKQIEDFAITGPGAGAERKFVVNITRTGVGALEANVPPGAALVFRLSGFGDFSPYALLGMSIYSREIRDDLKVSISTDRPGWERLQLRRTAIGDIESLPVLLRPGWNTVRIDLRRLAGLKDFDVRAVRAIRLWFSAATGPVRINLDDILLIDNRREIRPVPPGVRLLKAGLDYELHLPARSEPIRIQQGDDGLWRFRPGQPVVQISSAGSVAPAGGANPPQEDLAAMGRRRVGEVEILEHNRIRLRIANTWYFPASAGQWVSPSVPMIRWEHTFYRDGRRVTDVVINNAGGKPISGLRIATQEATAWSDGRQGRVAEVSRFGGSVARFSFLNVPETPRRQWYLENYVKPGRLTIRMGDKDVVDGDADGDGFDQSRDCYCLRARAGHCRFVLTPSGAGLADAVVRVSGRWKGPVTANSEGLALKDLVRLPDGSVLLVVPGVWKRPRWVELTGPVPFLQEE